MYCAGEGEMCHCLGDIYYGTLEGINDTSGEAWRKHASNGPMYCDNKSMQGDYIRDADNACYCDGTIVKDEPQGVKFT